jgi:hypothetical protein
MNYFKLILRNSSIAVSLCLGLIVTAAFMDWLYPSSNSALTSLFGLISSHGEKLTAGILVAVTLPLLFQSPQSVERD